MDKLDFPQNVENTMPWIARSIQEQAMPPVFTGGTALPRSDANLHDLAYDAGFAQISDPVTSTETTGSFPTTQASWPGGISLRSPGPNSSSVPSLRTTWSRPETM